MWIKVNDCYWRIKFVPHGSYDLRMYNGGYTLGVTDWNVKTVFLSDKLFGDLLYKVLSHEMCHVYAFSYHIYMPIYEEECLADFISSYGRFIINDTDYLLKII